MKKILMTLIWIILLSWCVTIQSWSDVENDKNTNIDNVSKADKIEITLFHFTQRCYSCNRMGELIKKTLEDNFAKESQEWKIIFQEINIDMKPKNTFDKYNATWLSVYINWITEGKENLFQETNIWRYLSDEEKFKEYLTKIINNL